MSSYKTKLKLLQIKRDSEFENFTKEIANLREKLKPTELLGYMQSKKRNRTSVKPSERGEAFHERKRIGAQTSRILSKDPKAQISRKESIKDLSKEESKRTIPKLPEQDKKIHKGHVKNAQGSRDEVKELVIKLQEANTEKANFILLYNESLGELNEMQEKSNKEICTLNSIIKKLQAELLTSNKECDQFKSEVNNLNKELTNLKNKIHTNKGGLKERESEEIERLNRDKEKSNEIISKMKDYVKNVTAKLFAAENDKNKYKNLYNRLLKEHTMEYNLKDSASGELTQDDSKHKEIEDMNKKLYEENEKLHVNIKELMQRLSELEQERDKLKSHIKNRTNEHLEIKIIEPNSFKQLNESSKRVEEELEIQQLGSVNGSLLKMDNSLNSRCQNLNVAVSTEDFSKDTFESERPPKSEGTKITVEENGALLQKIKQLECKQEDYERLLSESARELESERTKHKEQLLKFKDDYCRVYKDMNNLKKALRCAQEELISKENEIQSLKALS